MAAVAMLTSESGAGQQDQKVQLRFYITGAATVADAYAAMLANPAATATIGNLVRQQPQADPVPGQDDHWLGVIDYQLLDTSSYQDGESAFSIDMTGGSGHITQAIAHASDGSDDYVAAGVTEPKRNHGGTIGVGEDGSVAGVDIPIPSMEFSRTLFVPKSSITGSYLLNLYLLKGCTNDASWTVTTTDGVSITFGINEVTFLGAQLNPRGRSGSWVVQQKFRAEPSITSGAFAGFTGIAKAGADYIWFEYGPIYDNTAKAVLTKAKHAHVEKIARDADFTLLNP